MAVGVVWLVHISYSLSKLYNELHLNVAIAINCHLPCICNYLPKLVIYIDT